MPNGSRTSHYRKRCKSRSGQANRQANRLPHPVGHLNSANLSEINAASNSKSLRQSLQLLGLAVVRHRTAGGQYEFPAGWLLRGFPLRLDIGRGQLAVVHFVNRDATHVDRIVDGGRWKITK